jgi:hypothetical protein
MLAGGEAGGALAAALAVDPPVPEEDALAVPALDMVTVAVPDPVPVAVACVAPGLGAAGAAGDGVSFGTGIYTGLYSNPVT